MKKKKYCGKKKEMSAERREQEKQESRTAIVKFMIPCLILFNKYCISPFYLGK